MARHIDDVIAEMDDYLDKSADVNALRLAKGLKDLAEIVKEHIDTPFGTKVAE
jgi:hypothetical protein